MKPSSQLIAATVLLTVIGHAATTDAQPTVREGATALLGADNQSEIDSIATVLALQIATFPVGSSSGGFTLKFDNGTVYEVQNSFGPFFAERAPTLGVQGAISLGVNMQTTRFVSFEGQNLRSGELASTVVRDGRLINFERFTFNVSTQTTTVVASLAVDDDKDLSVVVPIVRTSLSGTRVGEFTPDLIVDANGSGLGDVAVRGKWRFLPLQEEKGGLAAVAEVTLPTGSEERLTTTGRVRVKGLLVASAVFDGFAPHVNVGYTFGGPGTEVEDRGQFLPRIVRAEAGDEFNYVLGGEAWPARSVTVFADLIGRSLRNVARYDRGRRILDLSAFGPVDVGTLVARSGTLDIRLAAVGAKVQVLGTGLMSFGLLFPLNEGGIKPGLTPVIGFDYTFGKRVAPRR